MAWTTKTGKTPPPDVPCTVCYTPLRLVDGVWTCPRGHEQPRRAA